MNWFRNLFSRPRRLFVANDPRLTEDWKAGDIALCISSRWVSIDGSPNPVKGRSYSVMGVEKRMWRDTGAIQWALQIADIGGKWCSASGFIKVDPPSEEEDLRIAERFGSKWKPKVKA